MDQVNGSTKSAVFVGLHTPTKLPSDRVLVVMTMTGQSKHTTHSDGTGRELPSMRKEYQLVVHQDAISKSSYLTTLLSNPPASSANPATTDQTTSADAPHSPERILRLDFTKPSTMSLDALVACLEYLASPTSRASDVSIDFHNQFQILAAASLLKIPDVLDVCITFVAKNLTAATVVAAGKFAVHLNSQMLLRACYYFTKSHLMGPGKSSAPTLPEVITSRKRAQSQAAIKPLLTFTDDGMMAYGNNSIALNIFQGLSAEDIQMSRAYNTVDFVYDLYYVEQINLKQNAAYPRAYRMFHDHNKKFVMMAYQEDEFSEFIISNDINFEPTNLRYDDSYLGSLSSNFLGTEFSLFDSGVDPVSLPAGSADLFPKRQQLCKVTFDRNVMGSHPRALRVRLPERKTQQSYNHVVSEHSDQLGDDTAEVDLHTPSPALGETDDMDLNNWTELVNKPPFWNEESECWMLDFYGRVNLASAKNFQLVQGEDSEDVFLMFGKMEEMKYSLDFRHPISKLQAFGIGLAGIARKLAVN
eukprot:c18975_g1_i1.p1 GENE.c18975_g1_i1~~c18975_g1_i1.p1  ORF type:complete len:537 (-),score=99.96 c18975_g1_i1:1718-3304(-)